MVFLFKSRLEAGSTVGAASSPPKTPISDMAAYLSRRVLGQSLDFLEEAKLLLKMVIFMIC